MTDCKATTGCDMHTYCVAIKHCRHTGADTENRYAEKEAELTEPSPNCGTRTTPEQENSERVQQFNAGIQRVTDQRGQVYGHPRLDFGRVDRLKSVVAECRHPLARHAMEMICVKMARLIETPDHLDSWLDIAGYARTGVMVTDDECK